jgi:hypothetical protein
MLLGCPCGGKQHATGIRNRNVLRSDSYAYRSYMNCVWVTRVGVQSLGVYLCETITHMTGQRFFHVITLPFRHCYAHLDLL